MTIQEVGEPMATRELVIRLAVAGLLLVAIGAAGNVGTTRQGQIRQTPKPPVEWLQHHQWLRFCPPFQPEMCAEQLL